MSEADLNLVIEFSAGAEMLFGNQKRHEIALNGSEKWTMRRLIKWLQYNLLTDRPELFMKGENVRPGILVLINDTDWEILGELDYSLKQNDNVLFISTLHGG